MNNSKNVKRAAKMIYVSKSPIYKDGLFAGYTVFPPYRNPRRVNGKRVKSVNTAQSE